MKENEKIETMEKLIREGLELTSGVGFYKNNKYVGLLLKDLLTNCNFYVDYDSINEEYKLWVYDRETHYNILCLRFNSID